MMLYSIKDAKSGNFANPFSSYNDQVAVRDFKILCKDKNPNNLVGAYPEDFDLFRVGSFDDKTGEIVPCCEFISNGSSLVEVK